MEGYINKEDGLWTNGCTTIKRGLTPFSDNTFECSCSKYNGCLYRLDNRCIYYVATNQIPISRACSCYEDDILSCSDYI